MFLCVLRANRPSDNCSPGPRLTNDMPPPSHKRQFSELIVTPLIEAGLLLIVGLVGLALGRPLLFASLGPTAYEQTHNPAAPASRLYNVFVGHMVGLGAGFASLFATGAMHAPKIVSSEHLTWPRIVASVLAVLLTTVLGKLLRCMQPAALATTLLVAIGLFQSWHDAQTIIIGVALVAAVGEPVRRWQLRQIGRQLARKERSPQSRAA